MSDKGWLCQRCGASNAPWLPTCQCKPPVDQQPVKTAPVAQGVSTTSDKIVWGQQ